MADRDSSALSVLVCAEFIESVQADLRAAFDCDFREPGDPDAIVRSLIERDRGGRPFDALLISLDTRLEAETLAATPRSLAAVATYSVGTDHIDLAAARAWGLAVFNTPGVLADSVAENAMFLLLGAARRATESIELVRSRAWSGWNPTQLVGLELAEKRLGILGMGDIGRRVAQRARAFGMEIHYCNRDPLPEALAGGAVYHRHAVELAAEVDFLLLAAPSTPETRGIVDASFLSHVRPGIVLVNIARGDLVVDEALLEALRNGRVWAAGLDVFNGEPEIAPGYFDLPNVFMLPHIGSSTQAARRGMGRILIDALEAWRAGDSPTNQVC